MPTWSFDKGDSVMYNKYHYFKSHNNFWRVGLFGFWFWIWLSNLHLVIVVPSVLAFYLLGQFSNFPLVHWFNLIYLSFFVFCCTLLQVSFSFVLTVYGLRIIMNCCCFLWWRSAHKAEIKLKSDIANTKETTENREICMNIESII